MQDIMADSFEDGASTSLHHSQAKPVLTVPLMDDPNDDFCRVCGYGVGCPFTSQLPERMLHLPSFAFQLMCY